MNKIVERLQNGIIKENPTFVLMLGMCPTLAVTTSAINGLGMAVAIWSEISIKSPGLKSVLRPPAAFVSISFFAPIIPMRRVGSTTSVIGYPS